MKFLLFSDLHYHPGVFMGATWEDLKLLQKRAEEEACSSASTAISNGII